MQIRIYISILAASVLIFMAGISYVNYKKDQERQKAIKAQQNIYTPDMNIKWLKEPNSKE